MAFSAAEKQKIRTFLGYSPFFKTANTSLETSLSLIESQYPEAETIIKSQIVALDDIDSKLLIAATAAIASDAENVKINAITATNLLQLTGRKFIKIIATTLGFSGVLNDYYTPCRTSNTINNRGATEFNGWS